MHHRTCIVVSPVSSELRSVRALRCDPRCRSSPSSSAGGCGRLSTALDPRAVEKRAWQCSAEQRALSCAAQCRLSHRPVDRIGSGRSPSRARAEQSRRQEEAVSRGGRRPCRCVWAHRTDAFRRETKWVDEGMRCCSALLVSVGGVQRCGWRIGAEAKEKRKRDGRLIGMPANGSISIRRSCSKQQ